MSKNKIIPGKFNSYYFACGYVREYRNDSQVLRLGKFDADVVSMSRVGGTSLYDIVLWEPLDQQKSWFQRTNLSDATKMFFFLCKYVNVKAQLEEFEKNES